MLPSFIVHADWSSNQKKCWMCTATLEVDTYQLSAPVQVRDPQQLVRWAIQQARGGGAILGFDFPIGIPRTYAQKAGIGKFLDALPKFGFGRWQEFFEIARRPDQISINRPFYPQRPGKTLQKHLVEGIGVNSIDDLLRRCDFGNKDRNNACALFWTLGGNQVGRSAISGWREVLVPAMRSFQDKLGIWPFQGQLQQLIATKAAVVVETYPGDACVQLGLGAPGRGWSKRDSQDRIDKGHLLRRCALQMRADLRQVNDAMDRGFDTSAYGEDQFDALVGLLGMLAVVVGHRDDGAPQDKTVCSTEGWIFGQKSEKVSWASSTQNRADASEVGRSTSA